MGHKLGKKAALSFNEGWFLVWFGFNFVQLGMNMQHGSVWYGPGLVWFRLVWTWVGPGLDYNGSGLVWFGLVWTWFGMVWPSMDLVWFCLV